MHSTPRRVVLLILATAMVTPASAATLQVGPGKTYTVPSAAAAVAQDGDVIEIDAGEYLGDVTAWYANNLTLRGVGGLAHLRANGNDAEGKATWVIKGDNTTVEWIEFSEASVIDQNGAGIRQEGDGLIVRHCYFHHNEDGILGGGSAASDVLIEYTEFAYNGFGDGYSHNLYISNIGSLTFRFNYTHHAHIGHNLKSRAYVNYVLFNRLMDENSGDSSRLIDLPNGGESYVIGNLIQQSPSTDNSNMFCFACEGASNPTQELYVINNTFVNDRSTGSFISNQSGVTAVVTNNIFVGNGTAMTGSATMTTNLEIASDPGFVNIATFNYRLTAGATAAVNQGTAPGNGTSMALMPMSHYVHPADSEARALVGAVDIGAYEFGSAPPQDGSNPTDGAGRPDGGSAADGAPPTGDPNAPGNDGGTVGGDTDGTPAVDAIGLSSGCGCGGASGSWLLCLPLLVALRRRRVR